VAGVLRLILLWVSVRLGNMTGADLGVEIFRRTLSQPYSVHISRNSSEIISAITQKVGTATSVLVSTVTILTSLFLFLAILTSLLIIDPLVAVVASLSFGTAYTLTALQTRRRLSNNGVNIAVEQTRVVKVLQEGLGAIRDVLLDGSQKLYSNLYKNATYKLQQSVAENAFINQAPRYAMEAVGIAMIALLALLLSFRPGGINAALPILGVLALGAQRLLPLMQQIYGNWSVLTGSKTALLDVLALLKQPFDDGAVTDLSTRLDFNDRISINDVSFRYANGPRILDSITFEIPKGARVGFVGKTGSGKSTLIDILMGLLDPEEGGILIDGIPVTERNRLLWQKNIAHVPQSIYLADATIAENIAFGMDKDDIEISKVKSAASQAFISDFIDHEKDGYSTMIGERGVRLSGGQQQRIGIARALYREAKVLVFDEATSALDTTTEKAVMEAIDSLNAELTILIIAHRISTLKNCDIIVEIKNGKAFVSDKRLNILPQ